MKIYNKPGSKERLFEMMKGVNKVTLNENYWRENLDITLNDAIDKLKSGALKISQGGSNRSAMQTVNNVIYVGINGYDANKNMYNFNFKIIGEEGDQTGVFNIQDVMLEKFYYQNPKGEKVFDVDEDDLREFNAKHGAGLYDIIEDYIDVDIAPDQNYDKMGEGYDQNSDPFGGSEQELQNGLGYVDKKPVNDKLRVDSNQLNMYVKEDNENGEELEGGLADNESVMEFDPIQILKGIEIEMEHTKDPKIALEIAMDHLKEFPDYYTRLEKMENDGNEVYSDEHKEIDDIVTNSNLPISNQKDDNLEDELLGFDITTPNTVKENDFAAREREYYDNEAYSRFKQLFNKDFNRLSDKEKEELLDLWLEFR